MNGNNKYPWQGMLVITMLMLGGILVIYFECRDIPINYGSFYNYFYKHGMDFIFSIFFIIVGLYSWISYIIDNFSKPHKDILFLKEVKYMAGFQQLVFINNKGRVLTKYIFDNDNDNSKKNIYEPNDFYEVIKKGRKIIEILDISNNKFEIKERKSYWLNFYTPVTDFEDIFLLPIVYALFLPGFLSFIMADGIDKIYGIIVSILPGYLIIYDAIKKIKKSND